MASADSTSTLDIDKGSEDIERGLGTRLDSELYDRLKWINLGSEN